MDTDYQENLSLDEIIKLNKIQPPQSLSTSSRGRGFVRPSTTIDPSIHAAQALLQAAYNAGVAAARATYSRGTFQRRGGGNSMNYQRGGFQQRMGNLRTGIQRPILGIERPIPRAVADSRGASHGMKRTVPGLLGLSQRLQQTIQGQQFRDVAVLEAPVKQEPLDLETRDMQISISTETVGKPALRDRLGWYPWQRLTPAQQAARSKLSLAKMRLNGQRPAYFVTRGKMMQARQQAGVQPQRWQPYGQRRPNNLTQLDAGVSPLLRQNVACLPGGAGGSRSQSVKSFSAVSHHSRYSRQSTVSKIQGRKNNSANKAYLAERQFDGNVTDLMSASALQERMRPQHPYGKYNRAGFHRPNLDPAMQAHIAEIQLKGKGNPVQSEADFEYAAMVAATMTSSSDRFSLMMGLGRLNTED